MYLPSGRRGVCLHSKEAKPNLTKCDEKILASSEYKENLH
jgi:hypothetical protein